MEAGDDLSVEPPQFGIKLYEKFRQHFMRWEIALVALVPIVVHHLFLERHRVATGARPNGIPVLTGAKEVASAIVKFFVNLTNPGISPSQNVVSQNLAHITNNVFRLLLAFAQSVTSSPVVGVASSQRAWSTIPLKV